MDPNLPHLYRKEHINFIERSLRFLSTGYECLDSSRPWLVYWIFQSAHVLNFKFSPEIITDVIIFLKNCRSASGGFGGGPMQNPHLAPTYAAVLTLCLMETEEAYEAIDM
jgi:protein farnesyltransferase subunit beta